MSPVVRPDSVEVNVVRTIADERGDLEGWHPFGITHNPVSGQILVADHSHDCIRVFSDNPPYSYITQYGRRGRGDGEFKWPRGITCDSEGRVIVGDCGHDRLQVLSPTGQYLGQVKGLSFPEWVHVDGEDNMYVTSGYAIRVYNPQGEPLPTISRRWRVGDITISGEHLYGVCYSDFRYQTHIHAISDWSHVKSVPLPQQIHSRSYPHITPCHDGRILITAWGWRGCFSNAPVNDTHHSYMYIIDGHEEVSPRPYRYDGRAKANIRLYNNTLVVVDLERRLQLVTLPGLDPPLQPAHPVRVKSVKNLCLYKIRSMIRHPHDVHKLPEWVAPGIISQLLELYPDAGDCGRGSPAAQSATPQHVEYVRVNGLFLLPQLCDIIARIVNGVLKIFKL